MSLLNTGQFSAISQVHRRLAPWAIGACLVIGIAASWWLMSIIPFTLSLASALALLSGLPSKEDHVNHTLRRQPNLDVLNRLASETDLQRSVFTVTGELVQCISIDECSSHFAHALRRYWRHSSCTCWLWDKGSWSMLPLTPAEQQPALPSLKPPLLKAPVTLPTTASTQLILDLSPAVTGQAVLVLSDAEAQPTIQGHSERVVEALAEVLRAQLALALRRAILHRELTQLARIDPLTEVDRRWYGEERLQEVLQHHNAVVAMLDIDYFKSINDRFGHLVGDHVLKHVGTTLRQHLRPSDILFRYGGEEFIVAIKDVDLEQGAQTIQRLLEIVENDSYNRITVTLSAGVVYSDFKEELQHVITRADRACYVAKDSGRNQIHIEYQGADK